LALISLVILIILGIILWKRKQQLKKPFKK
jgi:hypothetical protein